MRSLPHQVHRSSPRHVVVVCVQVAVDLPVSDIPFFLQTSEVDPSDPPNMDVVVVPLDRWVFLLGVHHRSDDPYRHRNPQIQSPFYAVAY